MHLSWMKQNNMQIFSVDAFILASDKWLQGKNHERVGKRLISCCLESFLNVRLDILRGVMLTFDVGKIPSNNKLICLK